MAIKKKIFKKLKKRNKVQLFKGSDDYCNLPLSFVTLLLWELSSTSLTTDHKQSLEHNSFIYSGLPTKDVLS